MAIDPSGEVLLETTDKVALVRVEAAAADAAKTVYPGYLKRFPELYAKGWDDLRS